MKINGSFFALLLGFTFLIGCAEEKEYVINEPVGGSVYYVDNTSHSDLTIEFPMLSFNVKTNDWISKDSSLTIPKMSRLKVYEDLGHFGNNPDPKSSFTEIRFYSIQNESKKLVLQLKPVDNNRWSFKIISRHDGYGLTDYFLEIKDDDLI